MSEYSTIDSLTTIESTPEGQYQRWQAEIAAADKDNESWHEKAKKTVRKWIDEREAFSSGQRWLNMFYTNTGIMEASLYANIPTADVSRKFTDPNDDVARVAGNILQRCIQQDMSEPECDFDQVMRQSVWDRLVPGLGICWLRLETSTAPQPGQPDLEQIEGQRIALDFVHWQDFLWSPCRIWAERRWVARKVYMTKDAATARWPDRADILLYDSTSSSSDKAKDQPPSVFKQAIIYEIWDRTTKKVHWFSKGCRELLETVDDPLGLDHFEPCPKPLMANVTTSKCLPKADYLMIQDQYSELDIVNSRISRLIEACKVVGVYDQSAEGVQRMLTEGVDNTLVPVDNWAMFAEKGGIKGQVDWLPLDMISSTLEQLRQQRADIMTQIYELTGISDIMRGSSKASETLGAQEIKAKAASVRIQKLQDEVTRYAESVLQIKADILVKHFAPEILAEMANVQNMDAADHHLIIPALQLLKTQGKLQWRVTIQSDAMAITDYTQQKTERTEFMNSVATFLQSAATVGQNTPSMIPLMSELLKFGVAGFRVGKDIEGTIDKFVAQANAELEQSKANPPPDPEVEKVKMKAQIDQQKQQQDMQQDQVEFTQKMQQMQQEFELKMRQMIEEHQLKGRVAMEESMARVETAEINADTQRRAAEQRLETQSLIDQQKVKESNNEKK